MALGSRTTTPGMPCGGGTTSPVWRERRALSPGRAGPAERGPQPAPPAAAAGPAQEGLGRRPAERHGRVQGTGESCAGLPRSRSHVRGGSARPGGECSSLRVKVPVPRIPSPKSFQPNGASEEALQCEIEELKQKDLALDQEIAQLLSEGYSLEELDKHISLLHEYNEIKDAGQMLLGKLAVIRGVTTKQLYPEYDLELSD
ncbi:DNA repair protein SWI5 homolog isoform X1 [Prinia subflava]